MILDEAICGGLNKPNFAEEPRLALAEFRLTLIAHERTCSGGLLLCAWAYALLVGMEFGERQLDLIIFDCDGVLVDSEVLSCCCLCEVLATCGVRLELTEALELFLGRSTAAVLQHYSAAGRVLTDNFPSDLKACVRRAFQSALRPIPGIASLLSGLRVPYCVASSSDLDRVSFSLTLTGLAPYFGGRIYTSQMVARGKPAPDLFLYAAANMHADPARALVIEDSVSGITAARAAGMKVWGFTGGSHYESRDGRAILYDAGADRMFDRMADFWKEGQRV